MTGRFNSWTEIYLLATSPYTRDVGRRVGYDAFAKALDKDNVEIKVYGHKAVVYHSDDTVTFYSMIKSNYYAGAWVQSEKGKGHRIHMEHHWRKHLPTDPLFYHGIRFDLKTRQCLNPLPDPVKMDVPEVSGPWRTKIRNYQRAWRVLAKCGGMEDLDLKSYVAYDTRNEFDVKKFIQMVEKTDVSKDAVENILYWSTSHNKWRWWHLSSKDIDLERQFNSVYSSHREEVREAAGCFKWEGALPK